MHRHTCQHALQLHNRRTSMPHATAAFMRQADDAIDVRVISQNFRAKTALDVTNSAGRAIDGADNSDIVAGSSFPVWPLISHERTPLIDRDIINGTRIDAILVF